MLDLLAQLAAAATPGDPIDWRHVTWPEHDTATMRALIDNNFVTTDGSIRTVRVTPAGVARLRARRKARWHERQAHGRQRAAELALLVGER